ncbi:MAG: substrate-binding domain-containing protein [Roseinatronobacter sp.]|nr:substrate-binding domain-containing protein [Roseinatronobacter sp.]
MTHRFPIKEIARQAGLGTATVDRVLNNRPHVSPQSRKRVETALRELMVQEAQLAAQGRRVFLDVLAEAPKRFSREIQRAAESALLSFPAATIRVRFQFHEIMSEADTLNALERIAKRGSNGICLKARDTPAVRAMIEAVTQANIPVFTLVTDLPGSARKGYFGLDNAKAGRIAAYLIAQSLPDGAATILTSRSQDSFRGETDRFTAFRNQITAQKPHVQFMDASGGAGMTAATGRSLDRMLAQGRPVSAVYSIGGGNTAILRKLAEFRQKPIVYVAHDLDRENRYLLANGTINYILHHDLSQDMRKLFQMACDLSSNPTGPECAQSSDIQIITPYNL